ncbi:glycoside hydrolase family 2 protein [Paenibacillus sp. TCA20]|uniref:glycoside hydrolase family 2 protein n=1 Tax=Paenibacillus sp. TCA20 TaxID=1499968 RepID=UPI000B2AF4B1|nr:sugar-binding domain-containing protein [Paenibacillus sp. TCA20]
MSECYRNDYPRPQFIRKEWLNLNGEWEFEFDDQAQGDEEKWWERQEKYSKRIQVPFAYQSKLSGIAESDFHDLVWYRRSFQLPDHYKGKHIIMHFGAVDYEASVWINGSLAMTHSGGHTPFSADITPFIQDGKNEVVVRAQDYSTDVTLPRGKQYWLQDSASIFYTRTTGIWQTVWLEPVAPSYIAKVRMTPDIDRKQIEIKAFIERSELKTRQYLKTRIEFKGKLIAEDQCLVTAASETRSIQLHDFNDHGLGGWWTPENPNLYDVTFELLQDGSVVDQVESYFGMRKISIENGQLCLNNRPYFQRLVLDQGYFPDGNLTPPSDAAIKQDVELTKAMGFNGARKHQKLEDPRYLYWCDKLGLLVYSEAANAYEFSEQYVERFTKEWQESIERDYNHPSIIGWVPLNESWGVPNIWANKQQQYHALAMYYLTKSLDPTRLVVSNDGWEMTKTDLFNIHDYEWRKEVLEERYRTIDRVLASRPSNRELAVTGFPYEGQPVLVSEFGGIAYKKSEWEGWGYSGAENDEDYAARLQAVIDPLHRSSVVQGFCYTQLTDVEQEINGLLTYDRVPKLPLETIKAIVLGKA